MDPLDILIAGYRLRKWLDRQITELWDFAAVSRSMSGMAASVAPRESAAAQGGGPCLPLADPGASATASGDVQLKREGNAGPEAHAPATAGPAGVPGGFGSRGAALPRRG